MAWWIFLNCLHPLPHHQCINEHNLPFDQSFKCSKQHLDDLVRPDDKTIARTSITSTAALVPVTMPVTHQPDWNDARLGKGPRHRPKGQEFWTCMAIKFVAAVVSGLNIHCSISRNWAGGRCHAEECVRHCSVREKSKSAFWIIANDMDRRCHEGGVLWASGAQR